MTREELIREIEKYAASARRTFDAGKNPEAALSRVGAMIERYKYLSKHGCPRRRFAQRGAMERAVVGE